MTNYAALDENSNGGQRERTGNNNDNNGSAPLVGSKLSRPFKQKNSDLAEPLNTSLEDYIDETEVVESGGSSSSRVVDPGDPYYVFRDDLLRKLELVDESMAEFLRVVHQTDTAVNTHELKDAKKALKRQIKNADSVLGDVRATVLLVEKDRSKFNRIDSAELYERKALVDTTQERLNLAKQELNSDAVRAKIMADERARALRRTNGMGATTDIEKQNTEFIVDSHARATLLMRQQDETLDDLDVAVSRVNVMSEQIHDEINQQNKMLDELDEDLTHVEEELGVVMGKLAKLLKTKNAGQLKTILCLTIVMIVLFLLVIYS